MAERREFTLIFDDGHGRFGPLRDLRPIFELRTGIQTTRQRLQSQFSAQTQRWARWVEPGLAPVLQAQFQPDEPVNPEPSDPHEPWRVINGRWSGVAPADVWQRVRCLAPDHALISERGELVAAVMPAGQFRAWAESGFDPAQLPASLHRETASGLSLLQRPWDLLAHAKDTFDFDYAGFGTSWPRLDPQDHCGLVHAGPEPIRVHPSVRLAPYVVLQADEGPIVIDERAKIGGFALLEGPCYVGPRSIVTPHTRLRPYTIVGPYCVVGGEINRTIFQGCAAKTHAGYLGHGYVGQWVNIGADTNASNLKNTLGSVRSCLGDEHEPEDTGRLKLGPIIGDFVYTGTGTRLGTGACLGTGAMVACNQTIRGYVPRLTFHTDAQGRQPYEIEKFIVLARRSMQANGEPFSPAMEQRLRELAQQEIHRLTKGEKPAG